MQLREKNFELTEQKQQLSVHIEIVAAENKQLWSRLSSLTKNNTGNQESKEPLSPNSHQNLIRSKTFTQNNPNPKLREKFKQDEDPEDLVVDVARFAISDDALHEESSEAFKKLAEELLELKQEALKQNTALLATHQKMKERKGLMVCKNCASSNEKHANKPSTNESVKKETSEFVDVVLNTTDHIDFLETKRKADALNSNDRICPMCGRIYTKDALFQEFMEHVETHFLEEDMSLESLNNDEPFGYGSNIIHQF